MIQLSSFNIINVKANPTLYPKIKSWNLKNTTFHSADFTIIQNYCYIFSTKSFYSLIHGSKD